MNPQKGKYSHAPILFTLIIQFWLSGLFIMSVVFTEKDQEKLNQLNLFMFISVGVGSFLGGIVSDRFNRITILRFFSVTLTIAAITIQFFSIAGYVIAGATIGPMNGLTFVVIYQIFPFIKERYVCYVLIGWGVSEITLGLLFMFVEISTFFYIILGCTVAHLLCAFIFLKKQKKKSEDREPIKNMIGQENIEEKEQCQERKQKKCINLLSSIFPKSLKPLIGGGIFMFVMQMFYYRIQFTLDAFGVSLELNTIVVGASQILVNLIFTLTQFLSKSPRRFLIRILMIALIGFFIFLLLIKNKIFETVIEGMMRLVTTSIMITLWVYLPELFYEEERAKGTNYITAFGVVGSALNGVLLSNAPQWAILFFLVAALLSTYLLHETFETKKKESMLNQQE